MTSNQLDYWRNKETERANRAAEYEKFRHNVADESLKKGELSVKQQEVIAKMADIFGKNGWMKMSELPPGLQEEIRQYFGFDPEDQDLSGGIATAWDGATGLFGSLGGRGIGAIIS